MVTSFSSITTTSGIRNNAFREKFDDYLRRGLFCGVPAFPLKHIHYGEVRCGREILPDEGTHVRDCHPKFICLSPLRVSDSGSELEFCRYECWYQFGTFGAQNKKPPRSLFLNFELFFWEPASTRSANFHKHCARFIEVLHDAAHIVALPGLANSAKAPFSLRQAQQRHTQVEAETLAVTHLMSTAHLFPVPKVAQWPLGRPKHTTQPKKETCWPTPFK